MNKIYLGIELGSTRIKTVGIDESFKPVVGGSYTWKSTFDGGIWTYSLSEALCGLKIALQNTERRECVAAVGISGMMHGYLAFDEEWNLLAPFRTWQNTITAEASERLTSLFGFNVPQRWSACHYYQALLGGEAHVSRVRHLTTLAGYFHYLLTGRNAIGICEASGIFPIDTSTNDYSIEMLEKFKALTGISLRELLPDVLVAGENAGYITEEGSLLIDGLLPPGLPVAPPEGDMGTGMVATNSVSAGTGNVSAGTSINLTVVLDKPLSRVYPEIDILDSPSGKPSALVHANNCTADINAWFSVLREAAELFGAVPDTGELYGKLFALALGGASDCGGVTVYNYLAGETLVHLHEGRPLVTRLPDADFSLANFIRAMLFASMATLRIGMDILEGESVHIKRITGHGGLFKTPGVAQRLMAAACRTAIVCLESAGDGGPFGMALLAAFMFAKAPGETLESFLETRVFTEAGGVKQEPLVCDADGFDEYMKRFRRGLELQEKAVEI